MINAYNIIESLDRRSNELLNVIQKYGPITNNMLMDMTKMKKSTLSRAMEVLVDKGIVVERTSSESTGGRKPIIFDVNSEKYYLVGVDISRTYIQIVIINLKMNIVGEKVFYGGFCVYDAIRLISECVRSLVDQLSIDISMVIGIGIGTVGPNFKPETTISDKDNNDVIKNRLQDELGLPVYIDNGANTAVMAEYYFGHGRGKNSISYVNCGVGVRTGIISEGILIRTINNYEDAFAHMIVEMDGELCTCGNFGCVESYSSISRIRDKFISEVEKGKNTYFKKAVHDVDYIDICNLAEKNDEVAKNIIIDSATYFGTGLANYIKLLNPQMIILSGPLVKHSSLFYQVSKDIALKKCHLANTESIEFCKGGYFEDKSIAIGAAYLVLDEIIKYNKRT